MTHLGEIQARQLDVTKFSASPLTKVYDATTDAPNGFSISSNTSSGVVSGETVSVTISSASYNSSDVADANKITATISISDTNYSLSSNTVTFDATIEKATLTITITPFTGLIYNSLSQVLATYSVSTSPDMGYEVTLTINSETVTSLEKTNAGTYNIVVSLIGANYNEVSKGVSVTIAKFNLGNANVSQIVDQTYTGSEIKPEPTLTFLNPNNDTITIEQTNFGYTYTNNINVGTAQVTITAKPDSTNFTGATTVNFKIIHQLLDATVEVTGTTTYGETLTASYTVNNTGATFTTTWQYKDGTNWVNVVDNTQVQLLLTAEGTNLTTVAGKEFRYLLQATGNFSGSAYSLPTGTIARKVLTWATTPVVSDKDYDKSNEATIITHGTISGVIVNDDVTLVSSEASATFSDINAASGIAIIIDGYYISGDHITNYTLPMPTGVTATINKATPTISGESATGIIYGNALSNSVITATVINTNIKDGDKNVTGTFNFDNATLVRSVGTWTEPYTFTPSDTNNYHVVSGTVSVKVSEAELTITFKDITRTYDGTTVDLNTLTGRDNYTISGLVNNDTVSSVTYKIDNGAITSFKNVKYETT